MNTKNLSKLQLEIVRRMYMQSLQGNGRSILAGREWDGSTELAGLKIREIVKPLPSILVGEGPESPDWRYITAAELTPEGLAWANELWHGKPMSEFDLPDLPRYSVTTAAAADMLHVSLRRIQALIKSEKIKAVRFGRDWQIDTDSVNHYYRTRRNGRPVVQHESEK